MAGIETVAERINRFQDLRVYQECCDLDLAIFHLTRECPREEIYSLTDQIRRSSRSIGANISEAWAKRRYPAHFVSKLTDADGELQETEHWLGRATAYRYLNETTNEKLITSCRSIGKKLGKMIQNPESFS
jgi:four helix bundle protein